MRRDRVAAALRRVAARLDGPRTRAAWGRLRARPDAALALVLGAGVLAMVLHWL